MLFLYMGDDEMNMKENTEWILMVSDAIQRMRIGVSR